MEITVTPKCFFPSFLIPFDISSFFSSVVSSTNSTKIITFSPSPSSLPSSPSSFCSFEGEKEEGPTKQTQHLINGSERHKTTSKFSIPNHRPQEKKEKKEEKED